MKREAMEWVRNIAQRKSICPLVDTADKALHHFVMMAKVMGEPPAIKDVSRNAGINYSTCTTAFGLLADKGLVIRLARGKYGVTKKGLARVDEIGEE